MFFFDSLQYKVWEKLPYLPNKVLSTIQQRQISKLLKYAYARTPYYQRILNPELLQAENFLHIPTLRRKELQGKWEDMVVPDLPSWMYRNKGGTSGSTGEPIQFYCSTFGQKKFDIEQWYVHNKLWRFLIQKGYSMDQILNKIPMVELSAIRASTHPTHLYLQVEEMLSNPELMIEKVRAHKPLVFGCYGSFNLAFCKALHELQLVGSVKIPFIINTGEILLPAQRAFIEETLSGEVIDRYGLEEFYWAIASEQGSGQGLTSYGESYIVEILDNNDQTVPIGQPGRVIVTDLTNYTMPFIRYDTGDSGILLEKRGPFTRFSLLGRDVQLKFAHGTLYYYLINGIFSTHAQAITQYQFIKKSNTELDIKLSVTNKYSQRVTDLILIRMRELLGPEVAVNVLIVPAIDRTKIGKTKIFIDESIQQ